MSGEGSLGSDRGLAEDSRSQGPGTDREESARRGGDFRALSATLAVIVVIALLIRTFFIQAFQIPSSSMVPTLLVGDFLLVSKISYGLRDPFGNWLLQWSRPERGEVVVFVKPEDSELGFFEREHLIKRVIAVGGETIEFRNRTIYIDGEAIEDPWGHYASGPAYEMPYGPVKVPEGHLFVMGDNRNASADSRIWGFVPLELVVGEAFVIYYSADSGPLDPRWDRFGLLID